MSRTQFAHSLVCILAALLLGMPALAKEESKIQVELEPAAASRGTRIKLRSKLDRADATLHVIAHKLSASTEYVLTADGIEQARFTTAANGNANLKLDLTYPDAASPRIPFDPRGRYLALVEGETEIFGAWYSAAGEPRKTKVKEWTDLDASAGGSASARYDRRPNGKGRFTVQVKGAPTGTLDVLVDGTQVGSIDTNGSGSGRLAFDSKGNGKKKLLLGFDPRGEWVEIAQGAAVLYSGVMLAQIDGLNVCPASSEPTDLVASAGETGSGTTTLDTAEDCNLRLVVDMAGLDPGDHELRVGGATLATVAADGTGAASAVLAVTPDTDAGELPLPLDPSGGLLEVVRVLDAMVVLGATLP